MTQRLRLPGRRGTLALVVLALWLSTDAADAALPEPERVLIAAAKRNRDSGWGQGLRLEVALFIDTETEGEAESDRDDAAGDEPPPPPEPLALGTLWSHPDGRVGLELRAGAGFVERHLLRGRDLRASRDGAPLVSPRPFLPPFPLFQPRSSGALEGALRGSGVDPSRLVLGYEGDSDCYVVGGREGAPALWIDQVTLDPVRFDRGDGVVWRLGPGRDGAEPPEVPPLPSFIEVVAPGLPPARLEVRGGGPAESFPGLDRAWLAERPSAAPAAAGDDSPLDSDGPSGGVR